MRTISSSLLRILQTAAVTLVFLVGSDSVPAAPPVSRDYPDDFTTTIQLKLRPSKIDKPALRYALLPPFLDRTAGNGATSYYRAMLSYRQPAFEEFRKHSAGWHSLPFDEFLKHYGGKTLQDARPVLEELDVAARRETCDWELPIRNNRNVMSMQFPDMNETSYLGSLLAVNARFQLRDRNFEAANRGLQTGLALSRQVTAIPLVLAGLRGHSIANTISDCVEDWIKAGDSPNLYWPLTALPYPFIDVRHALEAEYALPFQIFPALKDPQTAKHSPEEWKLLLQETLKKYEELYGRRTVQTVEASTQSSALASAGLTGFAVAAYPAAKRHLLKKGLTSADIEKMSVSQALLIHLADKRTEFGQEVAKWTSLPYRETRVAISDAEQASWRMRHDEGPMGYLAGGMGPPTHYVLQAVHQTDRRIAVLRLFEALRDYAATHDGRLPAQLTDIKSVPVPSDPETGKPFPYRLAGDKAVIDYSPANGSIRARRYEISITK